MSWAPTGGNSALRSSDGVEYAASALVAVTGELSQAEYELMIGLPSLRSNTYPHGSRTRSHILQMPCCYVIIYELPPCVRAVAMFRAEARQRFIRARCACGTQL